MTTGYETQPAQPAWQAPAAPRRSGWLTTSAVVLLAVGALSALFGLIFLIIGLAFGSAFTEMMAVQPDVPSDVNAGAFSGIFTGFMVGFAIISLIWAAAHIAAGVGILGGRGWARITGMVLSVIGLAFGILGVVGLIASVGITSAMLDDPAMQEFYAEYGTGAMTEDMMGVALLTNMLFILPFVIGYLIILVALIRNGAFFDRRAFNAAPSA